MLTVLLLGLTLCFERPESLMMASVLPSEPPRPEQAASGFG